MNYKWNLEDGEFEAGTIAIEHVRACFDVMKNKAMNMAPDWKPIMYRDWLEYYQDHSPDNVTDLGGDVFSIFNTVFQIVERPNFEDEDGDND
jgi:hypothetical protein